MSCTSTSRYDADAMKHVYTSRDDVGNFKNELINGEEISIVRAGNSSVEDDDDLSSYDDESEREYDDEEYDDESDFKD